MSVNIRERFAELSHQQWVDFINYLFSVCANPIEPDTGTIVVPKDIVEEWKDRIKLSYNKLNEEKKEHNRKIADSVLRVLGAVVKEIDQEQKEESIRLRYNGNPLYRCDSIENNIRCQKCPHGRNHYRRGDCNGRCEMGKLISCVRIEICQHDPTKTFGSIGMYHCPDCGMMVLAGSQHPFPQEGD